MIEFNLFIRNFWIVLVIFPIFSILFSQKLTIFGLFFLIRFLLLNFCWFLNLTLLRVIVLPRIFILLHVLVRILLNFVCFFRFLHIKIIS